MKRPSYEIDNYIPIPTPDGRARFGPRGSELTNRLDAEAIEGIKSGIFSSERDAAKCLAGFYRPSIWDDMSQLERNIEIGNITKRLKMIMARLHP